MGADLVTRPLAIRFVPTLGAVQGSCVQLPVGKVQASARLHTHARGVLGMSVQIEMTVLIRYANQQWTVA